MAKTLKLNFPTLGNCDFIDITPKTAAAVVDSGLNDGFKSLFGQLTLPRFCRANEI